MQRWHLYATVSHYFLQRLPETRVAFYHRTPHHATLNASLGAVHLPSLLEHRVALARARWLLSYCIDSLAQHAEQRQLATTKIKRCTTTRSLKVHGSYEPTLAHVLTVCNALVLIGTDRYLRSASCS